MISFVQFVVDGLAVGSIYALLAIGFSLVYGIIRILNLAHGDTYGFSTILIAGLVATVSPTIPALLAGVLAGALIAVGVERLCHRLLRGLDRALIIIASLAVAFMLRNASEYFWGVRASPFPALLGSGMLEVGGIRVAWSAVVVFLTALGSIFLFGAFLRRTRLGKGVLLVAQDVPAASLMGVPVSRTVMLVFALSGVLGVVGGILFGATYGIAYPEMGFAGTIKAFVASVAGGIGNLTGALIAGLALGVIETLVVVYGGEFGMPSGYRDAVAFVVLIVFLLVKPTGLMGTKVAMSETVKSVGGGEGLGGRLTVWLKRHSVPPWTAGVFLLSLFITVPVILDDPYILRIGCLIFMYGIAALGINIILGYARQFQLGQAAFLAIGAYTTALMMVHWESNIVIALVVSTVVAVLFGLLISIPALRLTEDYLALVTLAFGEIVRLVLLNSQWSRGPMGIPGIPTGSVLGFDLDTMTLQYYYALLLFLLGYSVCRLLTDSHVGRAWKAIATDEVAAETMGINTRYYKMLAFAVSCGLGGVAGSYYATFLRFVEPNSFTLNESVIVIIMAVMGGLRNLLGALLGAAVILVIIEVLRPVAELRMALTGLVILIWLLWQAHPDWVRRLRRTTR